jgi:hypothetical protein
VKPRLTFVLEEHLGHRTHALNLRSCIEARSDIVSNWVTVEYAPTDEWWEHLPFAALKVAMRGRHDVAVGRPRADRDVTVFSTPKCRRRSVHVPSAQSRTCSAPT